MTFNASTSSFNVCRVCCMSSKSCLDTVFTRGERGSHLPFLQSGEAAEGERYFMTKIVVMRVSRIAGKTRVLEGMERSIEEEFNRLGWS